MEGHSLKGVDMKMEDQWKHQMIRLKEEAEIVNLQPQQQQQAEERRVIFVGTSLPKRARVKMEVKEEKEEEDAIPMQLEGHCLNGVDMKMKAEGERQMIRLKEEAEIVNLQPQQQQQAEERRVIFVGTSLPNRARVKMEVKEEKEEEDAIPMQLKGHCLNGVDMKMKAEMERQMIRLKEEVENVNLQPQQQQQAGERRVIFVGASLPKRARVKMEVKEEKEEDAIPMQMEGRSLYGVNMKYEAEGEHQTEEEVVVENVIVQREEEENISFLEPCCPRCSGRMSQMICVEMVEEEEEEDDHDDNPFYYKVRVPVAVPVPVYPRSSMQNTYTPCHLPPERRPKLARQEELTSGKSETSGAKQEPWK